MGHHYTNVTVWGASPSAVRDVLTRNGVHALVTPELLGCVVVYDQRSDDGESGYVATVAQTISTELRVTTLGAQNLDDDVLLLHLFHDGHEEAQFVNLRAVFFGAPVSLDSVLPIRTAWALCRRFRRFIHLPYVWLILQRPYLFQVSKHIALARALGLPAEAIRLGFRYVRRGEIPQPLNRTDLLES